VANLDAEVAVIKERLDTIDERNQKSDELQTKIATDIAAIKLKLEKQSGFLAGVLAVFTALGGVIYYLAGPVLQLFKWKHG
jgi:hypothetical protein